MSDDEDFYYEDDDWDEIWFDDIEPGIADDLAETSHYEAAFVEDPSLEAAEYFSDWDEQSDDYFDEDPTAIRVRRRRHRVKDSTNATSLSTTRSSKTPDLPERLKNKLRNGSSQTGNDQQQQQEEEVLAARIESATTFHGVIWKNCIQPDDKEVFILHEPGNGEKVALLRNWRELFKDAQPSIHRSGGQRTRKKEASHQVFKEVAIPVSSGRANAVIASGGHGSKGDGIDSHGLLSPENLNASVVGAKVDKVDELAGNVECELGENTDADTDAIAQTGQETCSSAKSSDSRAASDVTDFDASTDNSVAASRLPRRGRKRKASVSVEQPDAKGQKASQDANQPKSKRVALKKKKQVMQDTNTTGEEPSGNLRRSMRRTK